MRLMGGGGGIMKREDMGLLNDMGDEGGRGYTKQSAEH